MTLSLICSGYSLWSVISLLFILIPSEARTIDSPSSLEPVNGAMPPITDEDVCVALPSWQNPSPVPRLSAEDCKTAYRAFEDQKMDPELSFFRNRKFISRNNASPVDDPDTVRTPINFSGQLPTEGDWLSPCMMVIAMLSDFDKQQAQDEIPGYPEYEIFYAERSSWDRVALAALNWIDGCMEVAGQEPRVPKPGWAPVGMSPTKHLDFLTR